MYENMVNRSLAALLAFGTIGCAAPREYYLPCTVTMTMTVAGANSVDRECHEYKNLRNDRGSLVAATQSVNGCAHRESARIHARDNDATIAHEVRHLLKWKCGVER